MPPGSDEFNETYWKIVEASRTSTRHQIDLRALQGEILQRIHPELCKVIEVINATRDEDADPVFSIGSRMDLYANGWFPTVYVCVGVQFSSIRDPEATTLAGDIAGRLRAFAKQLLESADKIEAGKAVEA
jgi:hypothetical protein